MLKTVLSDIVELIKDNNIVFLVYGGCLTQKLIVDMVESLESEVEKDNGGKSFVFNLSVIFIELSQNILKYSQSNEGFKCSDVLVVSRDDTYYYIYSINVVSKEQKEQIETALTYIKSLSQEEIKKEYKELRRSRKNKHERGGGIGFYEIARKADEIEFDFKPLHNGNYEFIFKISIRKDK